MKAKPNNSLDKIDAQPVVREYAVVVTPRTWWGRAIVFAVVAALLFSTFLFFSLLVAIGAAIVTLTVLIGMLNYVTKGPTRSRRQVDQDTSSVVDTERSDHDGVYRPRDY